MNREIDLHFIIIAFLTAFVVALLVTPVAIKLAPKIGAMDVPKDNRRMHKKPVPRFGGMAIFAGTMVSALIFLRDDPLVRAAMVGGCLIYALGVVDDLKNLGAKTKFLAQTLVAILMYYMGLRIRFVGMIFSQKNYNFGTVMCFIVTVLWIVGITNTINLIDGLDGLAAGVSAISCASIAYVAYIHGSMFGMMSVCTLMMIVAGSALGFLKYNFYPAKIFMGDSGSLFLGFMIAVSAVIGPLKRSTLIAVVIPVLVLGVPIFDTFFAIFRRAVNGRPIMQADKGHLHHHLMRHGYGQRRAVLMLYCISAILGMSSVLLSRELYKDCAILILIALTLIYSLLTDLHELTPKVKNDNAGVPPEQLKKEAERAAKKQDTAVEKAVLKEVREEALAGAAASGADKAKSEADKTSELLDLLEANSYKK